MIESSYRYVIATVSLLALFVLVDTVAAQPPRRERGRRERVKPSPADQQVLDRYGARNARVHDPSSIVKCKDEYWLFCTGQGIQSWRSKDLQSWERGPRVLEEFPRWHTEVVPTQRGHLWAPDIVLLNDRYWLYYSVSSFGKNTSAIGLVSSPTLDPDDPQHAWQDHGIVLRSQRQNDYNAIDPAVLKTGDGKLWMSFGSFWSGLKLVELDPATCLRKASDSPLHSIAFSKEIEAPHIVAHGDYYYLFVNWGLCCRGVRSTYNIRVGRSRSVTGPYLDQEGRDLMRRGGTLLLETDGPFIGPGHANVLHEDGKFWLSCHYYDGTQRGRSYLAITPLTWSEGGWPKCHRTE